MSEKKIVATKSMNIDIDKIVSKAKESYGKKEQGLANQLSTGTSIVRPTKDSDFVLWTGGDHWKTLTGLRGIPFGKIVQISGKVDSGKSSHSLVFIKEAQNQNYIVILWDSERKFSAKRFQEQIGGDPNNLLIVDTSNILNGVKAVAHFVNAAKELNPNCKILIIWDSVGASINSSEDSADDEDYSKAPAQSARETAFAVRKLNKLANKYINRETGEETIASLIINQTYSSIGVMSNGGQVEKGGSELYYLSSLIVQLSRKQDLTKIKNGKKYKYGIVSRAKVKKNHLFDGNECIAELDLVVSASGINLLEDIKKNEDIKGWDDNESEDE